jgi:hypothetical protein
MDLNQAHTELNIQFSIHNVNFCIHLKREICKGLVKQFGEADYEHVLSLSKPLCLEEVNSSQFLF